MTELRQSPSGDVTGNAADPSTGDAGLAAVLLPPVVHESSAAILVVDLASRTVTYANDLARELVPDRELPIPVDDWSAAAGLEDVSGSELPAATSMPDAPRRSGAPAESLLRVAQGQPVTGEAVTAARATAATTAREVLWVLGLQLTGAPEPISQLALVVFLPARNARLLAGVQESAVSLRDRAVLATAMSFTITDPAQEDNPLVWVNPAFTDTTGYTFEEAVGSNCRFLQGPNTDRRVVAEIRAALDEERAVTATLLNYRKDGSQFWNELSISPVRDNAGHVTHFVGVQADVTARVQAQQARDDALSQVALAADRLALLADFTGRMAMSQQPQGIVDMLARALTPRIGTWSAVFTFDDAGRLSRPLVVHELQDRDAEVAAAVRQLRDVMPEQLPAQGPIWRVLRGEDRQVHVVHYDAEPPQFTGAAADERTALLRRFGTDSLVVVPLLSRRGILGCLAVARDERRPPLGDNEVALIRDLAVRAGLMLENTLLYARERATAATLQRSLLPRLPRIPGLEIAASYVPAADEAAVGGDWYDVFALRAGDSGTSGTSGSSGGASRGGVGVVVGDVMGHNYDSAARMGKLSTIVRSYAWPGSEPSAVLTAVDELVAGTGLDFLATCLYAKLVMHSGGATLHYANAGHPPALVRLPDGTAHLLDGGRGTMIGVSRLVATGTARPPDAVTELPRGATLICFTDGLVDAFSAELDIDAGLAELTHRTTALPADVTPSVIVDELTRATVRHADDVAVVAIRID
jgi:PAS domain S-box-containing protein